MVLCIGCLGWVGFGFGFCFVGLVGCLICLLFCFVGLVLEFLFCGSVGFWWWVCVCGLGVVGVWFDFLLMLVY